MNPCPMTRLILCSLLSVLLFLPTHAQLRFGDIENKEVKEYIAQNDLM